MRRHLAAGASFLAISLVAHAGPSNHYVEKPIGDRAVKLPLLSGFSPACEENSKIARRAQLMTPKTSIFLTCFVEAGKWRNFVAGRSTELYPYIAVAVMAPTQGGNFSPEEFEKLRAAAHKKLGNLLTNAKANQRRLSEQDRKLAAGGMPIKRENYQQSLRGFFEPVGATGSFSFIAIRSVTLSEGGATKTLNEVNAVSTILYSGRLLGLSVVDQTTDKDLGLRAQEITSRWLHVFRELNESKSR